MTVLRKIFFLAIITGFFIGAASLAYCVHWLNKPFVISETERSIVVNKGESVGHVAKRLGAHGIIQWPVIWRTYARFFDRDPLLAGEFEFDRQETPISLLARLQSNDVVYYELTFYEGIKFSEMLALLSRQENLTIHLYGKAWPEQKELLQLDVLFPEGQFFPDTYRYVKGDSDVKILRRAYEKMQKVLSQHWHSRVPELPYKNSYEALIMASIVEKETGRAFERKKIAGVFVQRIKKKMRLQTDPTVIYGLGEAFDGNLKRSHLSQNTPYNTYRIKGLPPTPIAMPGNAAIEAALNPELGESLYFVAKGDGTHHFSASLDEHNKAVKAYQLKRRSDYRSSP